MLCCAQDINCTADKGCRVVDEENFNITVVLNAREAYKGKCTSRIAPVADKFCLRVPLKYYSCRINVQSCSGVVLKKRRPIEKDH